MKAWVVGRHGREERKKAEGGPSGRWWATGWAKRGRSSSPLHEGSSRPQLKPRRRRKTWRLKGLGWRVCGKVSVLRRPPPTRRIVLPSVAQEPRRPISKYPSRLKLLKDVLAWTAPEPFQLRGPRTCHNPPSRLVARHKDLPFASQFNMRRARSTDSVAGPFNRSGKLHQQRGGGGGCCCESKDGKPRLAAYQRDDCGLGIPGHEEALQVRDPSPRCRHCCCCFGRDPTRVVFPSVLERGKRLDRWEPLFLALTSFRPNRTLADPPSVLCRRRATGATGA